MSLIVYGAPLSPFVRKLRLFLAEKGLEYQLEIITPFGQPEWYRELSPLGRIPALKDDDFALADSSVICHYLEEKHPDLEPLYGSTPAQRARHSRRSSSSRSRFTRLSARRSASWGAAPRWQNRACRPIRVSISCPFMALLCGHAQRSGSVVGAFAAGVSGFATAPSNF